MQELGAYAVKCGMDATSIVPPNFFKPGSIDALVAYLKEALKTSTKLPFYYYHTGMSGVNFDMEKFLLAADGKIKNLAGIKFNYPDLYMYQRCVKCLGGKYDITWGIDEWFAGAVAQFLLAADGKIKNLAGIKFNYPDLYMYQRCIRCLGGKYDITWGIDEWFAGAVALGAKSAIGSTYNYSAGFSGVMNFHFGLNISTDLNLRCRRGYADEVMNTNQWIWNAQVSYSFLKRRNAMFTLRWNDILQQRDMVNRSITATARTDGDSERVLSYVLLTFTYRFHVFGGVRL